MNMTDALAYVLSFLCIIVLPFITIGTIRKTKARMQNRVGAPILQPLFDFCKLLQKGQTLSDTATWLFRGSCALNLATMLLIAWFVPWLSFKPSCPGDDLFLLLYLLAVLRFMTILSSLDTASVFGAFGASREAYLGMLSEPAMFISLAALGLLVHSSSLSAIFNFSAACSIFDLPVWIAAATGLFLSSIVDLSRMPIDDPTTHLELTMVHEAMHIEHSGRNLALADFTHLLKMVVLYGLSAQCLLRAATYWWRFDQVVAGVFSVVLILLMGLLTAFIESGSVKVNWRATPDFIAYALTASLFATAGALIGGVYARHGL